METISLEVELVPIKKIKNTKVIDDSVWSKQEDLFKFRVERYKKVLKAGGIMPPIVINHKNEIFDGQCRWQAHKELGRKKIMCLRKYEV